MPRSILTIATARLHANRARGPGGARPRVSGGAHPDHRAAVVLVGFVLLLPAARIQPALVRGLLHVVVLAALGLEQPAGRHVSHRSRDAARNAGRARTVARAVSGTGAAARAAHFADGRSGHHRRRRRVFRLRAIGPDRRLRGADPRAHDACRAVRRHHRARDAFGLRSHAVARRREPRCAAARAHFAA